MAVAQKLDVYRDMYSLLMTIEDLRVHFPKMYKYDFGNELFMTGVACCELIQSANMTRGLERFKLLQQFIVKFGTLKLLLRICKDRRVISIEDSAKVIVLLENIGPQATAWKNATLAALPDSVKHTLNPEP